MSRLVLCVATRRWHGWFDCVQTWTVTSNLRYRIQVVPDQDVLPAYQELYETTYEPILGFLHDDLEIYEPDWDLRVMAEFDDPTIGMVGFGGARGHGTANLYEVPYHLPNLARQGFMSNMREWYLHGSLEKGNRDVAVLDGFAVFVRRSVLDSWKHYKPQVTKYPTFDMLDIWKVGGFPFGVPVGYFMWCENLCCEVRRQGFRIRLVGVECHHIGGRTSTVHQISDDYQAEHAYFYSANRDVMPYAVKE